MGIVKTGILSAVVAASAMLATSKPADAQFFIGFGTGGGSYYSPSYQYGPSYYPHSHRSYYGPSYRHRDYGWDRRDFRRAERRAERDQRRFVRRLERRFDWDD